MTEESPRRALNYNQSPDIGFDRSINPYRGCEHGCVYCYARPSHSYLGLSPGLDFESRLFAKGDIAKVLERELRKPGYQARPVMLGANTDCYQPLERERGLTRKVLEVLDAFNHPAVVVTKSTGVTRDLDILSRMAARNLARAAVSVTTLDADLARNLEPRAAAPPKRLETIRALADAGVPVTVMAAPIIPCLNDHELEAILQAAADAGACGAGMTLLRLPYELKDLFVEWLDAHAPLKKDRVLSHIRAMRGGQLYVADFKTRRKGEGVYADLLQRRFRLAVERFGLNRRRADTVTKMDISAFAAPFESGAQMAFL
ncbi:MAG: PA0069 family radical SAM protein [Rhodospirillales bacterium]